MHASKVFADLIKAADPMGIYHDKNCDVTIDDLRENIAPADEKKPRKMVDVSEVCSPKSGRSGKLLMIITR